MKIIKQYWNFFSMLNYNYDIFTTDATSHMTDEQFVTHVMPV